MFFSVFWVFFILLGVVSVSVLLPFSTSKQNEHKYLLPNGSMGWPFLGETLGFLKPHRSNSPGAFLQQRCSRYGRVFKSHLFGYPTIVSCVHELNMFILQNEEKLFRASYPKAIHGILGQFSLLTTSGELHKKLRNIFINFVSVTKSDPDFLLSVEKYSISMIESWKGQHEVQFHKELKKLTLNLMMMQVLSIDTNEPIALEILQDFLTYMKGFISLPISLPGTAYTNAVKITLVVIDAVEAYKARKRLSSNVRHIMKRREHKENDKRKGDFLDVIMSKQGLNDEERVSLALDILLGGFETTANLIALIAYFLAKAPTFHDKLKEEHQDIRANKRDGEPLNWEDYQKMELTYNVINEAMRCGNVVKFVHREAIQDIKFKEYVIPSGWRFLPVFTAVHFDPFLHDNPYEFNPMRWTDKGMNKKVMAFGSGPRMCPGAELAKVETAFILHHLVLSYRWKIKEEEPPIAYPYVEFKRGLLLEIEPTRDLKC